ncbi:MAG: hypothetical protein COA47_09195 [Robiginitomaculum sp.]|nr:MAG: hypothetical protein COA47_09195 [Robiginitomaculum sp.]
MTIFMKTRIIRTCIQGSLALVMAVLLVPASHGAGMDTRQRDLIAAAAIYTSISFSKSNRAIRRQQLPLSDAEYQRLDRLLPPRFQACIEGGFAIAFPQPEQARTLRLLMQSVTTARVPEPANASSVLAGFRKTNQWCSSRIPLWTSAILN